MFGELGQDFAIEFDFVLFEPVNKPAVGETKRADGGVNLNLPEPAEVTFFPPAVSQSVFAGVEQGLARGAFFLASAETEALSRSQDFPSAFQTGCSAFDSGHVWKN